MTAQISDKIILQEREYSICEISGEGLFHPNSVGLKPFLFCTACWRGYFCIYKIDTDILKLHAFGIGRENVDILKAKYNKGIEIFGQKPSLHKIFNCLYYENLDQKVNFTGIMVIGKDFIQKLYAHAGFQPAYKYQEVYKLNIQAGYISAIDNQSEQFAEIRQSINDVSIRSIEIPKNMNPIQVVLVDSLGWVTCPNCKIRFATYGKSSWDGERHISCKQILKLMYE